MVLQSHGQVICPSTLIDGRAMVVATLRLPGGKGGFGSMLRAIGKDWVVLVFHPWQRFCLGVGEIDLKLMK